MDEKVYRSTLAEHPDIKGVLPRFIGRLPGRVSQLRALQAGGDGGELQRVVHQLRGAGKSYGFAEMTELAAVAEEMLVAGGGAAEIAGAVEALVRYLEHIEGYAGARG